MQTEHVSPTQRRWVADVRAHCQLIGNAELGADIDSCQYSLADAECADPLVAEVVRRLDGERLTIAVEELARRQRLFDTGADVPDPSDGQYAAWREVADEVCRRADIVRLLHTAGCWLEQVGAAEWAGPCPACGEGTDRFRVWTGSDGRRPGYWCRRCQVHGTAITAYRTWLVPNASFYQATRVLAAELGLTVPDFGTARPQPAGLGELRERVYLHAIG